MAGLVTNVENGWTVISKAVTLPSVCRKLRHLRAVLVRHMNHNGRLIDSYYTLETEDGERIYSSEVCEGTLNPVWADLPQVLPDDKGTPSSYSSQRYVVRILNVEDEELMCQKVDLGNMKLLASSVDKLSFIVSPQVLFEFEDGVFMAEETTTAPLEVPQTPAQIAAHFDVCSSVSEPLELTSPQALCDIKYSTVRMTSLAKAITASKETLAELKQNIKSELDAHNTRRKVMLEVGFREEHVSALVARKAAAEERLRKLQKQLVTTTEGNKQLRESLSRAQESYQQRLQRQQSLTDELAVLRRKKFKTQLQIRDRKNHLVQSLKEIFPIQVNRESQVLTVSNLHLNSKESSNQSTDDEAAASLGYVTHCLLLLSRIWSIPLRHTVYPIASRSYIHGNLIENKDVKDSKDTKPDVYPLFCTRGIEKQRYFHSILLLNKNVRQLLQVRGLTQLDPKQLLFNLKELLESNQEVNCNEEE